MGIAIGLGSIGRVRPNHDASRAALDCAGQFVYRPFDVDDRNHCNRNESVEVLRTVFLNPVVVDLGASVAHGAVRDSGNPQSPRRIQDFRGDVVLGHELQPEPGV